MPSIRWAATLLALWPLLGRATSPYDAALPPPEQLSGVAIGECAGSAGGFNPGGSCEYAIDGHLILNGDGPLHWRGSSIVLDVEAVGGGHPSLSHIGDAQGVSNIEASWAIRPYEFYFSQSLSATGTQLRLGLIEISDQFMYVAGTSELINSSFGLVPTVSLNVPTSTYPKPGLGATLEQPLGHAWHLRAGVFQGRPDDRGSALSRGAFEIGELEYDGADQAVYSIGAWHYTQPGGMRMAGDAHSDWGAQASASALVPGTAVRLYTQVGVSPSPQSFNPYYTEIGLHWVGPFATRPHDRFCMALGRAWLRGLSGGWRTETAVEAIYSWVLKRGIYLQPDLQYVHRPFLGGVAHPDAVVALLRIYATLR